MIKLIYRSFYTVDHVVTVKIPDNFMTKICVRGIIPKGLTRPVVQARA